MVRMALVAALILGLATMATAGANPDIAIALSFCDCGAEPHEMSDCWDIVTYAIAYSLHCVDVYICGYGETGGGFTAARYGLAWDVDCYGGGFSSAADSTVVTAEYPGHLFIEQYWDSCVPPSSQPHFVGRIEFGCPPPHKQGCVWVKGHVEVGRAEVVDCNGGVDIIYPCSIGNGRAGEACFLDDVGCNPCPCCCPPCYGEPSAATGTGWGTIKSLYR